MSDYPSDDEVQRWAIDLFRPGNTVLGAFMMDVQELGRKFVDWARANPAPQEPPTCDHCMASVGHLPWCSRSAKANWPPPEPTEAPKPTSGLTPGGRSHRSESGEERRHYTHDVDPSCHYCVRDGLVSVPTSGDKPHQCCLAKPKSGPSNPIPTPEPTREPDPWALPEGWLWVTCDEWPGEWVAQTRGGWWWRGSDRPADGNEETQRVCDLISRRNREDPPKGGETP